MIAALLIAASVAAAPPAVVPPQPIVQPVSLTDISTAIDAGRLEQARIMIARAVAGGAGGPEMERLMADLAFGSGKYADALEHYKRVLLAANRDARSTERAALCALKMGDTSQASAFVMKATEMPNASWRAWNARGVLADLTQDWTDADFAYEKAATLAPDRAEVVNNKGWSQLLRGRWQEAATDFARAAALDPKSRRIANNLELARAALAGDLPNRRAGESDEAWAARLNDAGVAAELIGDKKRAIAAFSQALEASGTWYVRAANNLKEVSSQ